MAVPIRQHTKWLSIRPDMWVTCTLPVAVTSTVSHLQTTACLHQ